MSFPELLMALTSVLFVLVSAFIVWRHFKIQSKLGRVVYDSLPEANDRIGTISISDKMKNYKCGHRDLKYYLVKFHGDEISSNDTDLCHVCLIEKLKGSNPIHCYDCGLPIFGGEPITLASVGNVEPHPGTMIVGGHAVCCLRNLCNISRSGFIGVWSGENIEYSAPHWYEYFFGDLRRRLGLTP